MVSLRRFADVVRSIWAWRAPLDLPPFDISSVMNQDFAVRRSFWVRDLFLALLGGVATFAAFPNDWSPEYTFWPLLWVSHVPILWMLKDKSPKGAFWYGTLTGTIINSGGYYWIGGLMITFGHLPWIVAYGIMILHAFYLGLMWGIWAWILNRLANTSRLGVEWTAPLAMVAVEIAVPRIFPAYMGNSQYLFPAVMQIVDLFGITAVTFLLYRVNANLYLWLRALVDGRPRPWRITMVTIAMLAITFGYGAVRIWQTDSRVNEADKLDIGIVEADIGIFESETRERRMNHLLLHQQMSAQLEKDGVDLILWAESGYRQSALQRDSKRFPSSKVPLVANYEEDLRLGTLAVDRTAPIRGFHTPLLFTATTIADQPTPRYEGENFLQYNTAFLLDPEGEVLGQYDKVHLLVFGEYVPFVEYYPWIYKMIPALGRDTPGERVEVMKTKLFGDEEVRLGVNICYEGILPAFLRKFADQNPHILINLTNDDWFGKGAERYLHLALAVPRTIEHRLAMARATLTGVSAFIDPVGRIVQMTKPTEPETLRWEAPLLQSETLYLKIGDAFPYGCLILCVWLLIYGRLRRRFSHSL